MNGADIKKIAKQAGLLDDIFDEIRVVDPIEKIVLDFDEPLRDRGWELSVLIFGKKESFARNALPLALLWKASPM